jgi:hypothetical protein
VIIWSRCRGATGLERRRFGACRCPTARRVMAGPRLGHARPWPARGSRVMHRRPGPVAAAVAVSSGARSARRLLGLRGGVARAASTSLEFGDLRLDVGVDRRCSSRRQREFPMSRRRARTGLCVLRSSRSRSRTDARRPCGSSSAAHRARCSLARANDSAVALRRRLSRSSGAQPRPAAPSISRIACSKRRGRNSPAPADRNPTAVPPCRRIHAMPHPPQKHAWVAMDCISFE